jgi:oligopeptidase A
MTFFPPLSTFDFAQFPNQLDDLLTRNQTQLHALLQQNGPWTWDNLMRPLEDMDDAIEQLWSPLAHLHAVMNTQALRTCYQACLPKISAYECALGHNKALYEAIKSIHRHHLNETQQKIITDTIRNFNLAGVSLSTSHQQRFEVIDARLSDLSNQFENNLLDAEQHYQLEITDKKRLTGLPAHALHAAHELALEKGVSGWLFTLAYPTYLAILTYAEDRALRETFHYAYSTRASDIGPTAKQFDNTPLIDEILALRHEKANLLGFPDYAAYSLATKMASSPEQVTDFLMDLTHRAYAQATDEFHALQQFATAHCGLETLEPWDIAYVSQKKKEVLYALTDETLRPYFPLPHVMQGMLQIIRTLYNITLIDITTDVDTWHPDVHCYRLEDEALMTRGYLYMDLFARPNKRGGAWMDSLQSRRKLSDDSIQLPVATLTCNFASPVASQPPTLSHDEVVTLFHEFGHCLHHLLTKVDDLSASGINGVEWDAVELPSQFFENWCWEKLPLQQLSSHVDTHESISDGLFNQLLTSKQFQSAMAIMRQVQLSLFDFRLHATYQPETPQFVSSVLTEVRQLTNIVPVASYNRFQQSFSHIFAGGYAAGYYSYLWAEVLSSDAFARFQEEGIFNPDTGRSFQQNILEAGGSRPAELSFRCFRGRAATIDALLQHHGIK